MFLVGVVSALLGLAAVAAPANAQSAAYPTKPIRMLVGFPVGGGADVAARVLGLRMSEGLGQQIIVDNGIDHLAAEFLKRTANFDITLVPYTEAMRTLQMREVRDALIRQGMDATGSTPGEADAYLRAEIAKWTRVVKEAGIRVEYLYEPFTPVIASAA